jgi:hypothetical protein
MTTLESLKIDRASVNESEVLDRVKKIRAALPNLAPNLEVAAAQFGLQVPARAVHQHARRALPFKFFSRRGSTWWTVDHFRGSVPDQALLKYDEAKRTGLLTHFYVVVPMRSTARYEFAPRDPWLVGSVQAIAEGYQPPRWRDETPVIILAYWD